MPTQSYRVFFADDEEQALISYETIMLAERMSSIVCAEYGKIVAGIVASQPDVIVIDLSFPDGSGVDLLPDIQEVAPGVPVIVATGNDELHVAVECMRRGAYDYLTKPVGKDRLLTTIRRALSHRQLARERDFLLRSVAGEGPVCDNYFGEITTNSSNIKSLFAYIEGVAPSAEPVLIMGETGVGKELFSEAIHKASKREGKFVAVNTAGIDDHVFSDTLFGHAKGAFTGAAQERSGLIETAAGGTLFLDEIGDLDSTSQAKLLRLLQTRDYFRLGEDSPRFCTARIVAATNRDLAAMQEDGTFRRDLFYRLRTHRVWIPPLRERSGDLLPLVERFLAEAAEQLGKNTPTVPPQLAQLLATYDFPGNIRELKSLIHDAVSQHQGRVMGLEFFRNYIAQQTQTELGGLDEDGEQQMFPGSLPQLKDVQGLLIEEALRRTDQNKTMAANMLGTTRQALNHHLKKQA